MKTHVPIGHFERQTSYCPTYIAWHVLDEARDYFRVALPETYAHQLAARAERVFARQPFWRRKCQSVRGREFLVSFMRHWLAGILADEKPALFRQLPESLKIGRPLPEKPCPPERPPATARRNGPPVRARRPWGSSCFVHGGELLAG